MSENSLPVNDLPTGPGRVEDADIRADGSAVSLLSPVMTHDADARRLARVDRATNSGLGGPQSREAAEREVALYGLVLARVHQVLVPGVVRRRRAASLPSPPVLSAKPRHRSAEEEVSATVATISSRSAGDNVVTEPSGAKP